MFFILSYFTLTQILQPAKCGFVLVDVFIEVTVILDGLLIFPPVEMQSYSYSMLSILF